MAISLVLDCAAPQVLADFWAPALGYRRIGEAGQYLKLSPPEGESGPSLLLQRVDEPKTTKNRMHLDIHVADIEAEAQRLIKIGAIRVAGPISEHGTSWIVLTDPEGNEVCVCDSPG
jgi:predicted enzyme related to lactoylglutathione lyase